MNDRGNAADRTLTTKVERLMQKRSLIVITSQMVFFIALLTVLMVSPVFSQGTIFGEVRYSDLGIPANGEVYFVGYLDDTDEEIRIESCVGAGYDNGYWYDDFQNYLTEAPGNPYDFHFFSTVNEETAILSGPIPSNSYQQEDVLLSAGSRPDAPTGLSGVLLEDSTVKISWVYQSGLSYRIYRRLSNSDGSLFRMDDPTGSIFNPGVADSIFIDNTVDNINKYDYLVIPVDGGTLGLHSEIISVSTDPDQFICGDADGNSKINLLDITYIISYLYKGGPAPEPIQSADVNGRPGINLLDITYLIGFLYKGGPDLDCP